MLTKFKTVSVALIYLLTCPLADAKEYEKRTKDNHILHILTVPASLYKIQLVKAHERVIGRETVESMAQRTGADIAINAGFFEIGQGQDGMPSGTLIIDGHVYGYNGHKNSCLILDERGFHIQDVAHPPVAELDSQTLNIHKINKFPEPNDVVLYTSEWGNNTLTAKAGRKELVFDGKYHLIKIQDEGANIIPQGGYAISLPLHHPLDLNMLPSNLNLPLETIIPLARPGTYVVTGIPMLIKNGNVNPELSQKKSDFYATPHARTAVGLKANGDVIIVVAEHHYTRELNRITLGEIKELFLNNKVKLALKYRKSPADLTMNEIKEIIKKEYESKDGPVGLTLPQLAQIMRSLGCVSAINLDGGGSSSLWINGKLINTAFGDKDEALGELTQRPVADGIVFTKKSKSSTKP